MPEVSVLISAYGPEALRRIAALRHASNPSVKYLVGWQNHKDTEIPKELSSRSDFTILRLDSVGLCNNRNALLAEMAHGIAVIADDDLEYLPSHLENLLKGFAANPDSHFLTFRYESAVAPKSYPQHEFDLKSPPKGFFVTSMELAFNLDRIREDFGNLDLLRFNPSFGVNGLHFGSGEEDILVSTLLSRGFKGKFIPADICINTDTTTSERVGATKEFIATKGAVVSLIRPGSWPLRMLTHAWRACRDNGSGRIPFIRYCRWWLSGVRKARKVKIYRNSLP